MAEVTPISPLMHPKGRAAVLEDILITSELTRRRPRAPDYASENCALVALAQEMAVNPCNLLQMLVDKALDLCRAGTAGISVLKTDTDGEYLAWEALSGVLLPYIRSRHSPPFQPLRHNARAECSSAFLVSGSLFHVFCPGQGAHRRGPGHPHIRRWPAARDDVDYGPRRQAPLRCRGCAPHDEPCRVCQRSPAASLPPWRWRPRPTRYGTHAKCRSRSLAMNTWEPRAVKNGRPASPGAPANGRSSACSRSCRRPHTPVIPMA